MGLRKRRSYCLYMLFLCYIFVSCSNKKMDGEKALDTDLISRNDINTDADLYSDTVLLPDCEYIITESKVYLCRYMDEETLKAYGESLVQRGFQLFLEEQVGEFQYYHYTNGDIRIQVVDGKEVVYVSIVRDYQDMSSEEGVYLDKNVLYLIQEEEKLQRNEDARYQDSPAIVIKCWINELYEKTGMQAYTTFSKKGKGSGTYLIHDNQAYAIFDSLDNVCIADFDQNGTYELLSLFGFGSGIYRINLNVYQYENPIFYSGMKKIVHLNYQNCFVPKGGYGTLVFSKVSDSEVHLLEGTENGKDYGKLIIKDVMHVAPENMEEFPYYEWDHVFQPFKTDNNASEQLQMDQVPILSVKVADTTIANQSTKIQWNGMEEEPIDFSTLMTEDIPMFDCPNGFEFKDEICLSFDGVAPTSIKVRDYLIDENGAQMYGVSGMMEREVRLGEDGSYYLGLMGHWALRLSSNTGTYTNPSYRGFRVICEFGEGQTCEYVFVLSVAPMWEKELSG